MELKVGDKVRVKQGKKEVGETVWVIVARYGRFGCDIVEDGLKNAAPQRFDTSLLVKA